MSEIKTWQDRCEEHPDHQSGMVTHGMIKARMQEEIDDLRNQCEMWADACAMVEMNRDQLQAERDALAERTSKDGVTLARLKSELKRAHHERDALRADAERYRMLRQYSLSGSALDPLPSSIVAFTPNYGERNDFERLDKLVDDMLGQAARRADRATASAGAVQEDGK